MQFGSRSDIYSRPRCLGLFKEKDFEECNTRFREAHDREPLPYLVPEKEQFSGEELYNLCPYVGTLKKHRVTRVLLHQRTGERESEIGLRILGSDSVPAKLYEGGEEQLFFELTSVEGSFEGDFPTGFMPVKEPEGVEWKKAGIWNHTHGLVQMEAGRWPPGWAVRSDHQTEQPGDTQTVWLLRAGENSPPRGIAEMEGVFNMPIGRWVSRRVVVAHSFWLFVSV